MIWHGKVEEKRRGYSRKYSTQPKPGQLDTIMSINSMGFSPTTVLFGKGAWLSGEGRGAEDRHPGINISSGSPWGSLFRLSIT